MAVNPGQEPWNIPIPGLDDGVLPVSAQLLAMRAGVESSLWLAKAMALDAAVNDTRLLRSDDQRVPQLDKLGLGFTITDTTGSRSWVEGDLGGHPTDHAGQEIRDYALPPMGMYDTKAPGAGLPITDLNGNSAEIALDERGRTYPPAAVSAVRRAKMRNNPRAVTDFLVVGDSLVCGNFNNPFAATASALTGIPCRGVFGWYGNGATKIAFRFGAQPARITTGFALAEGQTVDLTGNLTPADGWRTTAPDNFDMQCELYASTGGTSNAWVKVPATLRIGTSGSTVVWQLVRGTDGLGPVTVRNGTVLRGTDITKASPTAGVNMVAGTDFAAAGALVLFIGRNNIDEITATTRAINAIIAACTRQDLPYIIIPPTAVGLVPSVSNPAADLLKNRWHTKRLTDMYGADQVLDLQKLAASTDALTRAGLTATSDDTAQIAAGFIPPSLLMADWVHPNDQYGSPVYGSYVADKMTALGWTGTLA